MPQVGANDLRQGMKIELANDPYTVESCEFVKPGKGQAFTRVKAKNLNTGRVLERTFKSNEKIDLADVMERRLRLLYREMDAIVLMDDDTYDQVSVPLSVASHCDKWLQEEILYELIFYKGNVIDIQPPTFMELKITECDPGVRGDTASGRVMKPATLETGAVVQVPIFVNEGEVIKVDTRTGDYVSRV